MRCAADPSVETYLRCGRCEKPICPRCLIQTPVGSRCRACARLKKLPMYQVGVLDYVKAIVAGLVVGPLAGAGLTLLFLLVPLLGFLNLFVMAGFGFIVGEAVARAVPRKSGTALSVIAALAVPVGLIVGRSALWVIGGGVDPTAAAISVAFSLVRSIWDLLGLGMAIFIAYTRIR
jgi:hypothetical protein